MARADLVDRFGESARTQTMFKHSAVIWGPIEDFWPRVPQGAKVEIWSYRSRHTLMTDSEELVEGFTELYFVNDSLMVQGTGFAPDGVVYESEP